MSTMPGYLTPEDVSSGSEWSPSDASPRKQKTKKGGKKGGKKGKRGKKNTLDTPKMHKVNYQAPSPPDTGSSSAAAFASGLKQQGVQNNQQLIVSAPLPLSFIQSSGPAPMSIPSNNQELQKEAFNNQQNIFFNNQQSLIPASSNQELQVDAVENLQGFIPDSNNDNQKLQENAFWNQQGFIPASNNNLNAFNNQQILLPPNNNSQCIQPSLLQDLSCSNGGSGMFEYKGKLYPEFKFDDFIQEGDLNMANPFGSGVNWLDPLMPDGTRVEDDPEYQAYAAELFNFEFDQSMTLGGPSTVVPSDAVISFKTEPVMDIPFPSVNDAGPTVTSERTKKAKAGSNANNNPNNIPLVCMLCENSPTFSDVSHLLTHISSKSHLSRRFQLDIKAPTDAVVKQRLDLYENWAQMNDIQQLLTLRQEAKEQKKETLLRRQKGPSKDKKARRNSNAPANFKTEPEDSPQMPPAAPTHHFNPLNQQNQQGWNPNGSYDNSYQLPSTAYQTPSHQRTRSEYPEPEPDSLPKPTIRPDQDDEPVETGNQAGSRTPTLKGVVYEGMGIFDAGTPEMKRMRNQKKDPSVVQSMMSDSRAITDIEYVWDSDMSNVQRIRSVYDTPTDMSDEVVPDHNDDEPPVKKARIVRAAPKPKPKAKVKSKVKAEPESPEPTGPATLRLTRSAARSMNRGPGRAPRGSKQGGMRGGKRARQQRIVEEEEWGSDEEMGIPQRQRGLSVYQEDAPDNGLLSGHMREGGRQGAQGLNPNPFDSQQSALGQRSAMQGLPANRPLSSMYGRQANQGFNLTDKENNHNAFSMQQSMNGNMQPGFYQQRQNMQSGGGFNPLCLQPQRSDNYNQAYGTGFDESKPSSSPFQNMNSMGYTGTHGGMSAMNGLSNGMANGMTNGMTNPMSQGMTNAMNAGLHNGMPNSMNHALTNGNNNSLNNGIQFQSGGNAGQSTGFDVQ